MHCYSSPVIQSWEHKRLFFSLFVSTWWEQQLQYWCHNEPLSAVGAPAGPSHVCASASSSRPMLAPRHSHNTFLIMNLYRTTTDTVLLRELQTSAQLQKSSLESTKDQIGVRYYHPWVPEPQSQSEVYTENQKQNSQNFPKLFSRISSLETVNCQDNGTKLFKESTKTIHHYTINSTTPSIWMIWYDKRAF